MTTISDERLAEMRAWCEQRKADKPWYGEGDESPKMLTTVDFMIALVSEVQSLRAQGGARVKDLQWTGEEGGPGKDIRAVVTPFMTYTVRHLDMDTFDVILTTDTGQKWFRHDNEIHASYAQAKSAAQADYERRILSSLEASPAPVSEYAANRDLLFQAASDPSLSDAAVRQLCLAKLGPVTSEVIDWADAALAAKGGQ